MKINILGFILSLCLLVPCSFIMSACNDKITDVAYVQFVPAVDGEYVQYTSSMNADSGAKHIYLFENEEAKNNGYWNDWEKDSLLHISFKRGLGVDFNIDDKNTLIVDIEDWSSMEIRIKKSYYYNSNDNTPKKVYLNGVDITSKADSTLSTIPIESSNGISSFWYDGVYYFEDFGLIKGNKSNFINTIEFK